MQQQQQQQQQQQSRRFEAITLDLDEEASAELRKILPPTGAADSSSGRCGGVEADGVTARPRRDPARSPATQTMWNALDLDGLLEVNPPKSHAWDLDQLTTDRDNSKGERKRGLAHGFYN